MNEEQKAVETTQMAAPVNGVETNDSSAPENQQDELLLKIEALAKIAEEADARAKKAEEEREHYKKGMLKAKGKLKSDDDDFEDEETQVIDAERIQDIVKKTLAEERQKTESEVAKKVQEIKTAYINRSQMPNAPQGVGTSTPESKGGTFWSKEQLEYFKAKRIDPEKVKANLMR